MASKFTLLKLLYGGDDKKVLPELDPIRSQKSGYKNWGASHTSQSLTSIDSGETLHIDTIIIYSSATSAGQVIFYSSVTSEILTVTVGANDTVALIGITGLKATTSVYADPSANAMAVFVGGIVRPT